ncbi:response regulator [Lachnobacterium bovis]|jgi:two-component system chemotaxis response regulator CheY|uniref:Stage 0 sporulation protein A homolog n=1 Tax=Lachnobacterium bovis DSM 14045 TaxID=1122142 RepID=A0A1H3LRA0_9FIRM|nr:response regulator [Lachnobacterium bovis]MBQ1802501.1 response regulator [Lachnobacterium sp.]SDY66619.1 two-component system, chemotaxis family, response regulator CheY [Lachnobacterium bovis DSM 14045]
MAKILICDDAEFMRLMIRDILEKEGHEVVGEADNGNTVVELYKQLSPDLVVMDITMPGDNGIKACEKIMDFDKDARLVICSAMGQKAMVVDAIKAGARDFITKPFKEPRIIQAVNRVLGL